ncbi:type II toxin-antitoxin system RelE/ParE family toxin [Marinobacterium lutimaris]|uniref:type II toxin-antitoxin system RelE/ParE family toxin n=1 Tax=Marinobacterium lutimaris TaxID=568106 RepID=UPI000CDF0FF7|nr:type II toxin-antitoxin system RelE/ParE family toxin [Marinobacterium lutimaris]
MNYSFHPAAEAEFLESVGYYESKVPGLGAALIEEFEALVKLLGELPKAWQIELPPDIRRVPFHRFPLSIVYRETHDGFQVLAIAHDRRRPLYWRGRGM